MNTAMEMVDKIRDTSQSHDRCSIVEVMGRNAGHLALQCGVAGGAASIVVPEVPITMDEIVEKIRRMQKTGKRHFIIVVAEGVGKVDEMAKHIESTTGIVSRATVLGHVQRGGNPTVRDRVVATQLGHAAVELLREGKGNRVVGIKDNKVVDYDIYEALNMTKDLDMEMYNIANITSI